LKPGAAVLAATGRVLLEFRQYALAKDVLEQAASGRGGAVSSTDGAGVTLDLAIATLHATGGAAGAKAALELVDRLPESGRNSDSYLARAEILDAAGKPQDALSALDQALRLAAGRPEIYLRANAFLTGKAKPLEALRVIDEGAQALPENREIMLRKATTLEYAGKGSEAEHLLTEVQSRWPEWPAVWLARGVILDSHQRYNEAQQALETATALGARSPEAYFFLADSALGSTPPQKDAAETAIREALKLSANDPWIQSLAGRIALARGEFQLAANRQQAAIRLRPRMVEAHDGLAQAYAALGRKQEAEAERTQAAAMRQNSSNARDSSNESPFLSRLFDGSLLTAAHR
jgi:predicted Zn-dependent protease